MNALQGKRWFIWTIVFLIVAGVGLTTWIMYTSADQPDSASFVIHRVHSQQPAPKK